VVPPNCSRIAKRAVTSSWTGFKKITASSAYSDSRIFAFLPLSGDRMPFEVPSPGYLAGCLIAKMNRYGFNLSLSE
jgi:hypothetical protein